MKTKNIAFLSLAILLGLTACGEKPSTDKNSSVSSQTSQETSSNTDSSTGPVLKEFEGLVFEGKSVTYSGAKHPLEVTNLPEGATVVYTNNDNVDVGTYTVSALVSKEGYVDKTLTASLTIVPADFSGIEFTNSKIEYDSFPHTVTITGNLPEGATVVYSCVEHPELTNTVTEVGDYTIKATITHKNYNKVELTATISITSKDEQRFLTSFGGKIFFQNALDKDRLYTFDSAAADGEQITKINNNKAQYFTTFKDNLYYRSDSTLVPAIVTLKDGVYTNTIITDNAEFICDDEQYIYYADNSLVGETGIYRVDVQNDVVSTSRLYDGKAYNLQVVGDYIYFADGKNHKTLSKIRKDQVNQTTASVVCDYKIKELASNGTDLFFTVNETLGDYIVKYDLLTSKAVKLTSDAGKYLTVVGNDLYYVNADLLNSNLFGKGIYKTSINRSKDNDLPGSLAIRNEYKDYPVNSLYYDDGNLYFYQTHDKKLYSYNINEGTMTDVLETFEPVPDTLIKSDNGAVVPFGNKVYYQNQYDCNNLYVYDTVSKSNTRVTSTAVDDLYIYEDYLYFRQVSFFVNKDLYRMNIKNGGTPELISKEDCGELEIFNDKIYYTNFSGKNEIHMMDLDGKNDTIIFADSAHNLRVYKNYLYYVATATAHKYIYRIDLSDTSKEPEMFKDCCSTYFEIKDDKIYFRRLFGVTKTSKDFAMCDLDGTNVTTIYGDKEKDEVCDPTSFVIVDNMVYYNNDVTGSYSVNSYNLTTHENKIIIKNVYAYNLQYVNGKLYYQSHSGILGDGHFYELALDGTLTQIA